MCATIFMVVRSAGIYDEINDEYEVDGYTLALWHFNEGSGNKVYDETAFDNDGSIKSATWTDGKFNSGLKLKNKDIVYQIPSSFDDPVINDITVEAWVYWEGHHLETYSKNSYIFDARDFEGTCGGFILYLSPTGTVIFLLPYGYGSSTYQLIRSNTLVNIEEWTHIAAVLDYTNGELKIYINGEEDATATATQPYHDFGGSHWNAAIGNNRYAPGDGQWAPFNGIVDEMRISNIARKYGLIPATIDIKPDTLNLKSKGKWITCYIELPENYDVADIDISTVRISRIDNKEVDIPAEEWPWEISDYDNDTIPDLMVKFDRSAVQSVVDVGYAIITVEGLVGDETFEGNDVIKVIDAGKEHTNENDASSVQY